MPDADIDYSDAPALSDEQLAQMVRVRKFRPVKEAVSIRIDSDVLAWLRSGGQGYQTKINQALRDEMNRSEQPKAMKAGLGGRHNQG
jgi:uncharacterized protein (DUF4415 family)